VSKNRLFPNLHQAPTEEQQEIKHFVCCLVSAGAATHAGGKTLLQNIIYPLLAVRRVNILLTLVVYLGAVG